jgi:hypothetical protein
MQVPLQSGPFGTAMTLNSVCLQLLAQVADRKLQAPTTCSARCSRHTSPTASHDGTVRVANRKSAGRDIPGERRRVVGGVTTCSAPMPSSWAAHLAGPPPSRPTVPERLGAVVGETDPRGRVAPVDRVAIAAGQVIHHVHGAVHKTGKDLASGAFKGDQATRPGWPTDIRPGCLHGTPRPELLGP